MVQLIKKEIEVTKEVSEIIEFVAALIVDIKAKKEVSAIVGENLAGLMTAIGGFEALPEEAKSEAVYKTVALGVADIVAALLKKPEAAAPVA